MHRRRRRTEGRRGGEKDDPLDFRRVHCLVRDGLCYSRSDPSFLLRGNGFTLEADGRDENLAYVFFGDDRFDYIRSDLFPVNLPKRNFHGIEVRRIVWAERRSADGVRELFGDAHSVSHGVHLVFRFGGRGDGGRSYPRLDPSGIKDDD